MSSDGIHPDLRRVARIAPRAVAGPVLTPLLRRLSALGAHRAPPSDVEVLTLASGTGVRLFRPTHGGVTEPAPALLWIHGGGYVMGAAQCDDRLCARFSRQLGITVASVDYRLAPEHPYPASLEDCYSALTWLAGLPAVDPDRVAIGGASAGGGLAAALALLARDRGELNPMFQLMVYPMLDDRSSLTADKPGYRLWNARSNRFGWAAYLGDADPGSRSRAGATTLAGCRRRGSASARRPVPRRGSRLCRAPGEPPGCRARSRWSRAPFTASTSWLRKRQVSQQFFDSQCDVLRAALAPESPGRQDHIAK